MSQGLSPCCNTRSLSNPRPSRAGHQLGQRLTSIRAAAQGQYLGFPPTPDPHSRAQTITAGSEGRAGSRTQHLALCPKGIPAHWELQKPQATAVTIPTFTTLESNQDTRQQVFFDKRTCILLGHRSEHQAPAVGCQSGWTFTLDWHLPQLLPTPRHPMPPHCGDWESSFGINKY